MLLFTIFIYVYTCVYVIQQHKPEFRITFNKIVNAHNSLVLKNIIKKQNRFFCWKISDNFIKFIMRLFLIRNKKFIG